MWRLQPESDNFPQAPGRQERDQPGQRPQPALWGDALGGQRSADPQQQGQRNQRSQERPGETPHRSESPRLLGAVFPGVEEPLCRSGNRLG